MTDNYLVRSGAKELLERGVASLLLVRPANPVAFLAHHFDTTANSVERSVRLLRACPTHGTAFQDALCQAFRSLSVDACATTPDPSLSESKGVSAHRTIPKRSYELVLRLLTAEFPIHIQDRVLDAVLSIRRHGAAEPNVTKDEFQRGVRICVLLEGLLDAVGELFFSIDKVGLGEIKLAVVVSALENASTTQQHTATTLDILKIHLRARHEIPVTTTSLDDGDNEDIHRSVRLVDLQEILFHAVFTPS